MSLSINVAASNSSNNLHHFQPKPMAISSITSTSLPNTGLMSSSPTETISSSISSSPSPSHQNPSKSPSPPFPSSPDSPNFNRNSTQRYDPYTVKRHSYQPPSSNYPFQHDDSHYTTQKHYHGLYRSNSSHPGMLRYSVSSIPASRSSSISSIPGSSTASPLSLQERRQRNKAASAKYRAKKNQQHGEMRAMISTLTKENDLLQRQLDHVKRENERLKATCDKYRGKILAEKMLKKLLNTSQQDELEQSLNQVSSSDDDDYDDDDELMEDQQKERFDEDIEFEDDDDQIYQKLDTKL